MEKIQTPLTTIEKESLKKQFVKEIQEFAEKIRASDFFRHLEGKELSFENFSAYIGHKYATTIYFTDFLKRGADVAHIQHLPNIQKSFQNNFNDESGIVNGVYDQSWEHETWRKRMLDIFNTGGIESGNTEYDTLVSSLDDKKEIFFLAGYLILTELFIAIEMKRVWEAMNRDLPKDLTQYDKAKIPNNPLEYIKNHADHDTQHYSEILDAVFEDANYAKDIEECKKGVEFAFNARKVLYEYLDKKSFT